MTNRRIFAMAIAAAGLITTSCQTQNWSDFHPDKPQDLIDLLADTTGHYNPPAAVLAQDKLTSMGTAAFPALIGNLSDSRPACPCFQAETVNRTTVGDACLDIVAGQVERYSYHKGGPRYLTRDNAAAWWQEHRQKTLPELQVEALEWSIEKMETDEAYRWRREQSSGIHTLSEMKASLSALRDERTPNQAPEDTASKLADPQR